MISPVSSLLFLLALLSISILAQTSTIHRHNNIHSSPINPPRTVLFEEKTRLGSRPPSCHNKCNSCHPCMAIQVPTLPSHHRVDRTPAASSTRPTSRVGVSGMSAPTTLNEYSNYKPMGWKCHCGNHFYNP